ncbi:uncharacterized protein I206_104834 [Kwoniella pini CBS 10737]|uniref:Uncharacterized protein n=1 Tax=Kwoniella pini CBS 10737 TaxID=1296096 RepID=A0A1B9I842_9TREE|nr:uncharacterized protein I206_02374 [Kwoniella pini CBS 10737]OCF51659.1 hypothetical protein I206_02374 [Kwoniella pini CBS 10737]
MAQTISIPSSHLSNFYCPSSPDPTPLRLLAFSVAEAALQPDPNSPSFSMIMGKLPTPLEMDVWAQPSVRAPWATNTVSWHQRANGNAAPQAQVQNQNRKPLWDVVQRAKERRVQERCSPASTESTLPQSPPISPSSYNFVLPPNSPLAASVAAGTSPSKNAAMVPRNEYFPLFTQSAQPSPIESTFSGLDQSRPPPEFVPRLSASDFSAKARQTSSVAAKHGRTKSDFGSPASESKEITPEEKARAKSKLPSVPSPSRLPSLAQIQARVSTERQRCSSVGSPTKSVPRIRTVLRSDSSESFEVIKTPTDETPRREARIVLANILNRRPATPPSPPLTTAKHAEPRLAPFLRERTSGRLSGGKARPMSMPPMSLGELPSFEAICKANSGNKPSLKVTPPKERSSSFASTDSAGNVPSPTKGSFPWAMRSGMVTPTESRFSPFSLSTPPSLNHSTKSSPRKSFTSPASPTESVRSTFSSPSLGVPTITCTPAPQTIFKNGVEQNSDEEDVVLFEGDSFDVESIDSESEIDSVVEEDFKEEREKRAEAMKKRLMLRRTSE